MLPMRHVALLVAVFFLVGGVAWFALPERRQRDGAPAASSSSEPVADQPSEPSPTTITVVDSSQCALPGARLYYKEPRQREYCEESDGGPDGSFMLGYFETSDPGLDVVVTCPGHRSAVLHDVRGETTVTLPDAGPLRVVVRLGQDVLLPQEPRRLEGWLEWYDASRTDPRRVDPLGGTEFGASRVLEFDLFDPGEYLIGIGEVLPPGTVGGYAETIRRSLGVRPWPVVSVPAVGGPTEFVVTSVSDKRP